MATSLGDATARRNAVPGNIIEHLHLTPDVLSVTDEMRQLLETNFLNNIPIHYTALRRVIRERLNSPEAPFTPLPRDISGAKPDRITGHMDDFMS